MAFFVRALVIPAVKKRPKYGLRSLPAPLHRRIALYASAAAAASPALPVAAEYPSILFRDLSGGVRLAAEQVGAADLPENLASFVRGIVKSTEKILSERASAQTNSEQMPRPIVVTKVAVAADDFEHPVDDSFIGTWVLDTNRSDPPGPQLKALGVKWFMRQAAAMAKPRVTISLAKEAGSDVWCENIDVGHLFQQADNLRLDGVEVAKHKQGYEIKECSRVEDDGACVTTRIEYSGGQRTEIRRYIIEAKDGQPATYLVQNNLHMPDQTVIERTSYFTQVQV